MKHSKPAPGKGIWIAGVNPVRAALQSGHIAILEMICSRMDTRIERLVQLGRAKNIALRHQSRTELTKLIGHPHHQGIALLAAEFPYASLEEVMARSTDALEPLLVLDSIQDPQNLGAIFRSACFLGANGVIIPKDRAAQVSASVIKVAAGATAYLPIVRVTNIAGCLQQLKTKGLWVVGLDLEAQSTIYEVDLSVPLCLVVGNEQKGIRPLVRKTCDLLAKIAPRGPLPSLNAATAGAIALAEVQRQRTMR
ncbi:23S rRNA (guanosine(2251)-2'-O)-methyltransferase RlmB [Desulfoferrobacter suflitae]|uniref:23S rRNA (guanosine(2251)-2'-O)-methyltransferase RlmB n=1 Tax=Desulfoferrobacter suflitae TaxID=2865782 RepID=UPI002164A1B6|nr:23S rRNA (guanosine(2251)-2'-O)-methyltransferase RlmB [Desulfoferrobacter suflitae]MCK8600733.1 23S rRNA (guanosine(2251)-2'-O)-methyltransferase RlmB [Desulfoferrobacter suflitae]